MSRIAVERLESQRTYKESIRAAMGAGGVLDTLPASWLSDRGLTRSDVVEKLDRVFSCADRVEAQDCGVDDSGRPVIDILRANWCKCSAVCPVCSGRLQGRRHSIYKDPIRDAVKRFPHRYMVTFTVKDGAVLGERLDHLRAAFRAWYRKGQRRKGGARSCGECGKVEAALAGVELKKTVAGLWHVHIHALVFASERLDYQVYDPVRLRALRRSRGRDASADELRECVASWGVLDGQQVPVSKLTAEWLAVSGDSCNVDCRPLRGGWHEIQGAALEVLKYSSKLAAVGADGRAVGPGVDMIDLVAGTYGRRLFAALRGFRGLCKRDQEYDLPGVADYSIVWDYSAGNYTAARGSGFLPLPVREAASMAGKLIGQWRRDRRALLDAPAGVVADLPAALDSVKGWYRLAIKSVYRSFARSALVDSCRKIVLPPLPPPPQWVQCSLFTV